MHQLRNIYILLILSACSTYETDTSHAFLIYEENGITVAETTGGPKYEGELFTYEKILTLDQNEEIEESLLYRPIRFIMDEGGKYYVQDSGNYRIAVFDLDGEFSHSIGRQGQGPGEFQSISLLSARDGYVTIFDNRLQRTSVFDYNGRFIKHITFSKARVEGSAKVYEGPGNTKILLKRVYHFDYRPKIITSWRAIVFSVEEDTLCIIETEKVHEATLSSKTEASSVGYYKGNPYAVYDPARGFLMTSGIEPVMEWFNLRGELVQRIRLNTSPEPVTAEERTMVLNRLDEVIEETSNPLLKTIMTEKRDIADIPDFKGYWCWLAVDESGFIWAQKPYPSTVDEYPESSEYLIFSPDGEYLGITIRPATGGTISRGHILSIQRNAQTGSQDLIVYRIHPTVPGLKYP